MIKIISVRLHNHVCLSLFYNNGIYSQNRSQTLRRNNYGCMMRKKKGYNELNVCVSFKFICWSPTSQCDGIRRWGLQETIQFRWGPEGGALWCLVSSIRRGQSLLSFFLPCENTVRKWPICKPRRELSPRTKFAGTLILDFQASRAIRKKIPIV